MDIHSGLERDSSLCLRAQLALRRYAERCRGERVAWRRPLAPTSSNPRVPASLVHGVAGCADGPADRGAPALEHKIQTISRVGRSSAYTALGDSRHWADAEIMPKEFHGDMCSERRPRRAHSGCFRARPIPVMGSQATVRVTQQAYRLGSAEFLAVTVEPDNNWRRSEMADAHRTSVADGAI